MTIEVPDVLEIIETLLPVPSTFGSRTQSLKAWVHEHRRYIKSNLALVEEKSDASDMHVLRIFLHELLMRNVIGEGGERIVRGLSQVIQTKNDLTQKNYEHVLKMAGYRWGIAGSTIMSDTVTYFRDELKWNWQSYLQDAERHKHSNFPDDPLLRISGVGSKVRDLALSNFNPNYAAFDLHVTRVVSRIGLIAYGWELMADPQIDFGTTPSIPENYRFFHRLFLKLAELCHARFTCVDLDRIFWHFGRCICNSRRSCGACPIRDVCLSAKQSV